MTDTTKIRPDVLDRLDHPQPSNTTAATKIQSELLDRLEHPQLGDAKPEGQADQKAPAARHADSPVQCGSLKAPGRKPLFRN